MQTRPDTDKNTARSGHPQAVALWLLAPSIATAIAIARAVGLWPLKENDIWDYEMFLPGLYGPGIGCKPFSAYWTRWPPIVRATHFLFLLCALLAAWGLWRSLPRGQRRRTMRTAIWLGGVPFLFFSLLRMRTLAFMASGFGVDTFSLSIGLMAVLWTTITASSTAPALWLIASRSRGGIWHWALVLGAVTLGWGYLVWLIAVAVIGLPPFV